jgi:endoglucanase
MERIRDLLPKKRALGTDDWMSWLPPTANANLPRLNIPCVGETLLCFYTGSVMRPLCAGLFEGLYETSQQPEILGPA